jgi:virulence factor
MRIGVVGIGDIAKKAYLPILSNVKGLTIIPCTRNQDTLNEIMEEYHLTESYTDLDDLIKSGVDAIYVTSKSDVHYQMAKKVLEAKIPCHLDKPISMNFAETQELVKLAKDNDTLFMIGFNRRFVPYVQEVVSYGKPDLVVYQKNRDLYPDHIRRYIVEDFIHVVDTTRFLLQDEIIDVRVQGKKIEGKLVHVVVQFITASNQGILIMNYLNGVTEEVIEVMHPQRKSIIRNLSSLETYEKSIFVKKPESDWIPTLKKRGFENLRNAFLDALINKTPSPVSGEDALISHQICERIVEILEKQ